MVNGNRETTPAAVASSGQDIHLVKDNGWIQMHSESAGDPRHETHPGLPAGEDPEDPGPDNDRLRWLLPFLPFGSGRYPLPGTGSTGFCRPQIVNPIILPGCGRWTMQPGLPHEILTEYRIKAYAGHAAGPWQSWTSWSGNFSASRQGLSGVIEEVPLRRCGDRPFDPGELRGTAKVTIDRKREEGIKVGWSGSGCTALPAEQLAAKLKGKKAVGVIDRDVSFGWNCGHLFVEAKAALNDLEGKRIPMLNFIGGLNGADITVKQHGTRHR